MTRRFMAATLVLALMSMSVHTDADETAAPKPATAAAPSAPVKADASGDRAGIAALPVVTRHVGVFGGRRITYDAVVEQTLLPNAKGNPAARLISFSYLERGRRPDAARPVLFAFNGGPGSASLWTHLGFMGPRRIVSDNPVSPPTVAPFTLSDNPHSLLDVADLVFIDPVLTGFSRLLPDGRPEDFLGVTQDAEATAEFIRQWLTRHGRWNSPKFVAGASYGTTRAIALTSSLAGGVLPPTSGVLGGVSLNGVIVLAPALGGGGARHDGNDRGAISDLPTMAAIAWYHGKLGAKDKPVETVIDAARLFAHSEYLQALNSGYLLDPAEKQRIANRLGELTGVPAGAWLGANLRLGSGAFQTLLLRDQGLQIGAYDARFTLAANASGNDPVVDDPSMGQYSAGYVAALNHYLSTELQLHYTERYVPIAWSNVNFKWDYGFGPGVTVPRNEASPLATAMRRNPELRVFVAAGYFDLVTSLGAAEYALAHVPVARERLTLKGYPAGHLPFLGEDNSAALAADLRAFVRSAVRPAVDR